MKTGFDPPQNLRGNHFLSILHQHIIWHGYNNHLTLNSTVTQVLLVSGNKCNCPSIFVEQTRTFSLQTEQQILKYTSYDFMFSSLLQIVHSSPAKFKTTSFTADALTLCQFRTLVEDYMVQKQEHIWQQILTAASKKKSQFRYLSFLNRYPSQLLNCMKKSVSG